MRRMTKNKMETKRVKRSKKRVAPPKEDPIDQDMREDLEDVLRRVKEYKTHLRSIVTPYLGGIGTKLRKVHLRIKRERIDTPLFDSEIAWIRVKWKIKPKDLSYKERLRKDILEGLNGTLHWEHLKDIYKPEEVIKAYLGDVYDLVDRCKLPLSFRDYVICRIHFTKIGDEYLFRPGFEVEPEGKPGLWTSGAWTVKFNGYENRLEVEELLKCIRLWRDRQKKLPFLGKEKKIKREEEVWRLLNQYPQKSPKYRWREYHARVFNDKMTLETYRTYEQRLKKLIKKRH